MWDMSDYLVAPCNLFYVVLHLSMAGASQATQPFILRRIAASPKEFQPDSHGTVLASCLEVASPKDSRQHAAAFVLRADRPRGFD